MDRLNTNQSLGPGGSLVSPNGKIRLDFQHDGNLVLYRNDNGFAVWSTKSQGKPTDRLTMQDDGNLVLYERGGNHVWSTRTHGANATAILQDDGNFVVYAQGVPLWASNTVIDWSILMLPPQRLDLGNGHYMVTDAEFHPASRMASFHLTETCTNKLFGFTGGVKLLYYDAAGTLLGDSGTLQYGIGQAPIFGAGHRSETWNGQAPPGTVSLGLAQFADPHNRFPIFDEIGNAFSAGFRDIKHAASDIGKAVSDFCSQNPNVCVAATFALVAGAVILTGGGAAVVEVGGTIVFPLG